MDNKKTQYNSFIKSSVAILKTNKVCYVYNQEQIEDIKKIIEKKKLNQKIEIEDNECGYTLRLKNIEK